MINGGQIKCKFQQPVLVVGIVMLLAVYGCHRRSDRHINGGLREWKADEVQIVLVNDGSLTIKTPEAEIVTENSFRLRRLYAAKAMNPLTEVATVARIRKDHDGGYVVILSDDTTLKAHAVVEKR